MEQEKRFCRSFSLEPAKPTVYVYPDGKVQVKSCNELMNDGGCKQSGELDFRCPYLKPQVVVHNMTQK